MRRAKPSRQQVAAALRHYQMMRTDGEPPGDRRGAASGCEPGTTPRRTQGNGKFTTTLAAAKEDFREAKLLYAAAIQAVMAGLPFAAQQVADALQRLNQARAELALLEESGL